MARNPKVPVLWSGEVKSASVLAPTSEQDRARRRSAEVGPRPGRPSENMPRYGSATVVKQTGDDWRDV
jgi:hypothetical protein